MQSQFNDFKKYEQENITISSSVKKFEGKMTTLHYEQKITNTNNVGNHTTATVVKNTLKAESVDK